MNSTEHKAIRIKGGRIIDPFNDRDEVADLFVVDGSIAREAPGDATEMDATGLLVCPGFMDLHVHLREPGQTHKETIETGTAAAAAGGFTFVACMPNTIPTIDHPELVRRIRLEAKRVGQCEVGPVASITQGRRGKEVTDFSALRQEGAVAFSDDGTGVEDDDVMRAAFARAKATDSVLIQHCEYKALSAGGVMHDGAVSKRLALPGLDPRSEEDMIERDIALCRETGGRYHVAHISTSRAVELVRAAKADGLPVTTEVTPHHLLLTDAACMDRDPNTKMHPPLRERNDVEACRQGLLDGTIDCVATDHAPHGRKEKAQGFLKAPPGIVGLETAVGLTAKAMIETGMADWSDLVRWFSTGAEFVLKRGVLGIQIGQKADLTLIDPNDRWTVDESLFRSKSRNTPFSGWNLTGRALGTVLGRRVRFQTEDRIFLR